MDQFLPARLDLPDDATLASRFDATVSEAREVIKYLKASRVFRNSSYQVTVKPIETRWGKMMHLSIKRLDKQPIHDWRELQEIKNQLVGPECEAVELYPANSRLVDTANQYHLWAIPVPGVIFPFGFVDRCVSGDCVGGAVQRPFAEQEDQSCRT